MAHDEGSKVPCPLCGSRCSRTLETRARGEQETWRRRLCLDCGARFSTLEQLLHSEPALRLRAGRLASTNPYG